MPPRSIVGKLLQKKRTQDNASANTPAQTPSYVAPTDPVRSATLLTRLRDLSVDATAQLLTLGGRLEARRAAIVQAVKADDHDKAGTLLDALEADLDKEKALARAKAAFDAAVGDLLKPRGAVATAKALATPSQALRALRQDLIAKEKAVNDLLLPATLDHAEATRRLPALAVAAKALVDAKAAWDKLKADWDGKARDLQDAKATLAKTIALGSPQANALNGRMRVLDKAVADGDLKKAIDALPALRTDIQAAHQSATDRKACEDGYAKVAALHKEASRTPQLTDELKQLAAKQQAAWTAFRQAYGAGRYAEALRQLPLVQSTSQDVIKGVMGAASQARPEISQGQQDKADRQLAQYGEKDRKALQALLDTAPTPKHKQNLQKAIACGHSPSEVAAFNARIAGKDEQWLQDNLRLAATSEGTGVQQQWVMSCQATTVQAARAEIDPIYALSLRDASPQLHELIPQENTRLATEQKQMLESAVVEDLNAGYQQGVAQRLATESPADAAALQALIDNAASNWEKNQVMEVIARPQKYTAAQIDAYYKANVQGKNTGGKAVHKTDQSSATNPGEGRFAVDLLNREQASTGVKYVNKSANTANRDAAVDDVATSLEQGKAVPLIVGQQDGETAHYVLAVSVHPGPPKTFFIHDPASGTTVARTEAQMKNNQLDLPSGWNRLNQYEKPSDA